MRSNKIRHSKADVAYLVFVYLFLALFVVAVIYPLLYVLNCSFSSPKALVSGKVYFWPVDLSLIGYRTVFKSAQVWSGYRNSLVYTAVYTVLSVFVTMLGAFPLSRREFPAKKMVTWIFSITMFIGGGLIPSYLLILNLGLMNTMWALIIPGLVSAWTLIIARTFITSSIPEEMFEAASIDGSSYFGYFFRVILPLSKPLMAVLALRSATGMWNAYFPAMLYIADTVKLPLQNILRNILVQNIVDYTAINQINDVQDMMQKQYLGELLKYALIVVSSLPVLMLYPFIQKYFIKGVMIGSIKG